MRAGIVQVDRECALIRGECSRRPRWLERGVWQGVASGSVVSPLDSVTIETNNTVQKADGDFVGLGNRSQHFSLEVGTGNYFLQVEKVWVDHDGVRTGRHIRTFL